MAEQLSLFEQPEPIRRCEPHPRSLPPYDGEGGAFDYTAESLFLGRRGHGPLRVALDTSILIDYGTYGAAIWSDADFDPDATEANYRAELFALYRLLHLWTYRDIRLHVFARQLDDCRRRITGERAQLRMLQVKQLAGALRCLGQGTEGMAAPWGEPWPQRPSGISAVPYGLSFNMTGDIILRDASTTPYDFAVRSAGRARVFIDDKLVVDDWPEHSYTGNFVHGSFLNSVANSHHRIRVQYSVSWSNTGGGTKLRLEFKPPSSGVQNLVPGTDLNPRYGLATTSTDPDGKVTKTDYGPEPELGLPRFEIVDPSGANLRTETQYEPRGDGYLRRTRASCRRAQEQTRETKSKRRTTSPTRSS